MKEMFFGTVMILALATSCLQKDAKGKADSAKEGKANKDTLAKKQDVRQAIFDTADYNKRMLALANGDTTGRWPVKGPYPLPGAILPFKRVVAYYGNLYSKKMGALGEFPKKEMFKRLMAEVQKWKKADSLTPVVPALHYIAVTAQGAPGADGKYRMRMPLHQVDTVIEWAKEIDALVFVDVQVGHSTVKEEVSRFKDYYKLPHFHLGIDPEFSMKGGETPGSVIGTFNASDINDAIDILAAAVKENNLPPKILVIHRFTNDMVMGYQSIKKVPEVQVVIDMDGWGGKALKAGTYRRFIFEQPVQFAGFKLFYKNDFKKGTGGMYAPEELVRFTPKPIYIQYQ